MTEINFCCEHTLPLENADSPFSRIIAFDYYDGPHVKSGLEMDAGGAKAGIKLVHRPLP